MYLLNYDIETVIYVCNVMYGYLFSKEGKWYLLFNIVCCAVESQLDC